MKPPVSSDKAASQALRQRAEAWASDQGSPFFVETARLSPTATTKLLHELQVHQIELEMQNDALRESYAALERTRNRYFDLYDLAPVGYVSLDAKGQVLEANLMAADLLGVTRSQLVGRSMHGFFLYDDQDHFHRMCKHWQDTGEAQVLELRVAHPEGKLLWVRLAASLSKDQDQAAVLRMTLTDITAEKTYQTKLNHMVHFDALTGLPNRLLKADRLNQAMIQASRTGHGLALVYIDLDGFKAINDVYGHATGDQMLVAVAKQMQAALREGDTLARIGGDEFVAVLNEVSERTACAPLLERLLTAAAKPVQVDDQMLRVSASLGVTFYPQDKPIEADQLLRQADHAMYQAKLTGVGGYQIFDAKQAASLRSFHEDLQCIQQAFTDQEFLLYYQPKVNMRSGQLVGLEALIRWQHPTKGLLVPSAFLPVIENQPLATQVGEWVMDTALTQMAVWKGVGLHLPVSVNLGAHQMQQLDFVPRLSAMLARHPTVDPADFELEILETSALQDTAHAAQVIGGCRQFGVRFALDDFGTGYSSLTYLKRLKVDTLKIDQGFVRDMLNNPDDLVILKGIIGLASAFGYEVIAEGVETLAHGALLMQIGCDLAQGNGVAMPMPAHEVLNWTKHWCFNRLWRSEA